MAEKFCIEELKNLSMDVVKTSSSQQDFVEHIEYIYANTPESSPMRRFIANHIAYDLLGRKGTMSSHVLELIRKGGNFAADFALATMPYSFGAARPSDPNWDMGCTYHEHKLTESCP